MQYSVAVMTTRQLTAFATFWVIQGLSIAYIVLLILIDDTLKCLQTQYKECHML